MFRNLKNKFLENGYFTVPFPDKLIIEMRSYIDQNIREIWKDYSNPSNSLEQIISQIPDPEWSSRMGRFSRIFPLKIGNNLEKWSSAFVREVFDVKRTAVGVVYSKETKLNSKLTENSPAIYYRFVRPYKPDVGCAHREVDFWMVEFGDGYDPKIPFDYDYRDCIKFWIPISGCTSETSIQVIPKSHRMEIPTSVVQTEYGRRPSITDEWVKNHENDFIAPVENGSCLVFHMGLVHRGPINKNNKLRMSSEITLAIQ